MNRLPFRLGAAVFTVALLVLLFCPIGSIAQVTTAEIVGTVTDHTGAVIVGANVTAKHVATGVTRTMQTSTSGVYAFSQLPIGTYSVTVETQGFKKFVASEVTLSSGDRARVDASLQVGNISESVEVTAQAAALQTDSSSVGALVGSKAVQDLPVNGRNMIRLVQLTVGLTESVQNALGGGNRPDDRRQTSSVSANGQNDAANNFLLDGMDNNERAIATVIVKPSIDALAEVRVLTSMYPADISRAGGAVINMITKAGANQPHGSLFEFLRNDKMDAKNFFNVPQAGNPLAGVKPEYRQNQFGGSLGGAIKKDKLFFFTDYEGFRKVQGNTVTPVIPNPCILGRVSCNGIQQLGNYSTISTLIYDPTNHAPFTNNVIPVNQINTVAANYALLFPTGGGCSQTTVTCTFVNNPNTTQYAHTGDARVDYRFSEKDTTYVRYSINNTDTVTPDFLPLVKFGNVTVHPNGALTNTFFPATAYQRQQSGAISHTHMFSPTLLAQLAVQVSRYVTISASPNSGVAVNDLFGGPPNANGTISGTDGLNYVTFNDGVTTVGDAFALPTAYWNLSYQYSGSLNWTKGSHTLKFGASVLRRTWSTFQHLTKGRMDFSGNQSNSTFGAAGGTGGDAFASMLLGYAADWVRNLSTVAPQYRAWEIGEFVQDDWRVSHWLTINLGLRYDIFTPQTEKHNNLSNFDPTNAAMLATGQIQLAGQNGYDSHMGFSTQYGDVQPRLGFAATVGKGLVVRGGFGIGYFINNLMSPASLRNGPLTSSFTLNQAVGTPNRSMYTALPTVSPNSTCLVAACGATGVTSVPSATATDFHWGSNYMENLVVEKEFGDGNIVSVGYITQQVRHLPYVIGNANANLPPMGPGGCGVTTALSAPNPCQPYYSVLPLTSSIQLLDTKGFSNYGALQVQFQRRYRKGLTFSGNYAASRSLSDSGSPGGACTGCAQVLNMLHSRDYGPSDYMQKHRFNASVNYELPFGKSLKGVAGAIGKGWQVNAIYTYGTGQPFTVMNGSSPQQNVGGITSDRPDWVQLGAYQKSVSNWFDTTAFRKQAWGTAGNEGHNMLVGPPFTHMDTSVSKDFAIRESVKLQFRAEAFNVTNTKSLGMPGSTISGWSSSGVPTQAGNFGVITSTNPNYTPRDIQFALKLVF